MATIDQWVSPTGKITYRVRTRLKGQPRLTARFARKTDARIWGETTVASYPALRTQSSGPRSFP